MAVRTVTNFFELLDKSQLLTDVQLATLRDEVEQSESSAVSFATKLVRRKVLSRWQAEQLLAAARPCAAASPKGRKPLANSARRQT